MKVKDLDKSSSGVYYVEPYKGNEPAVGFDLGSNPVRLAAIKSSRETGKTLFTGKVKLVQEKGSQNGFLLFRPVFKKSSLIRQTDFQKREFMGFALGVYRVGDIVETALQKIEPAGINILLFDSTDPRQEEALHTHKTRLPQAGTFGESPIKDLKYSEKFAIGERTWRFEVVPAAGHYKGAASLQAWGAMFFGIMASIFLALYLESTHRRNLRELASYKARIEAEEKLADILKSIDKVLLSVYPDKKEIVYVSPAAEKILGWPMEELHDFYKVWEGIVHPDDRKEILKRTNRTSNSDSWTIEYRIIDTGGNIRWMEENGKKYSSETSNNSRIDMIISDISKRKEMEQ